MRWLRATFLPVSLLILMAAAFLVPLPIYLERPGPPVSLAACVDVEDEDATAVAGDYLLMTISVSPGTVVDALVGAVTNDIAVVRQQGLIPAGVDPDAYFRQQRREFASTADVAAAVGLEAAGLPTQVTGDGVSVIQTVENTPAADVLLSGDIITEVNGRPVGMEADIAEAVSSVPVGQPLTLRVKRRGEFVELTLTAVDHEGKPIIGIIPGTDNPRVTLPVRVDVSSGPTGGPSAGLTIALTVYDQVLPEVDLAAGRIVAGTGTVDYTGRVGPIGGARLKVLAAHRTGADVFLVPSDNHAEAVAALPDDSAMEIVEVATFEDARRALETTAPQAGGESSPRDPETCPYDSAT